MTGGIIGPVGDQDRLGRQRIRGRRDRGRLLVRGRGRFVATIFILASAIVAIVVPIYFSEPSVQSMTAKTSRAPMPVAGQIWYAMGAPIGCRDKADLRRLTDLSERKDPAFRTLYGEKSLAGLCKTLLDDTPVQVENSDESGSPCVRPEGERHCLFVMVGQLKSSSALFDTKSSIPANN
jgi:hypothetical protein